MSFPRLFAVEVAGDGRIPIEFRPDLRTGIETLRASEMEGAPFLDLAGIERRPRDFREDPTRRRAARPAVQERLRLGVPRRAQDLGRRARLDDTARVQDRQAREAPGQSQVMGDEEHRHLRLAL